MSRLTYAAQGLGPADIEDLMPPDAEDHAPSLPTATDLYPLYRPGTPRKQAALEVVDEIMGTGASNNWVVSGARTRSGKPLLANDPHLRLTAPSIWHLAHLALEKPGAATFNMAGAGLAGMPLIVLGAPIRWPGASPTPAPTCRTSSSRRSIPTIAGNT
jgi:penicillin amidase